MHADASSKDGWGGDDAKLFYDEMRFLFLRISPRVWQILFGKSCVLLTPNIICQVKKETISKRLVFLTCQNQKKAHNHFFYQTQHIYILSC
jgi:hypothetical protein